MAKKIIDVSEHQGIIDWNRVKSQIDGAILRVGYGDNIASQDDWTWKRNADECTRLGIPFGVYIYSYATSMAQADSEAQHALRCIKGYKLSYPVYLDLEEPGTQSGAVQRANRFGDIIEGAGYMCGVYANLNWWTNYLGGLERFTKWIAQYNSVCQYTGSNKDAWQYTSSGRIVGIVGNVDMNHFYRDFPKEISGGKVTVPKPASAAAVQKVTAPKIIYGVKTLHHGILHDVDGESDFAGYANDAIVAVKIGVTQGRVEYRVHCDGRWLKKVSGANWKDYINGYAGDDVHSIDAIQIYYYTDINKAGRYYSAVYKVKPFDRGSYLSTITDTDFSNGDGNGTAGIFGTPFTQLVICLK